MQEDTNSRSYSYDRRGQVVRRIKTYRGDRFSRHAFSVRAPLFCLISRRLAWALKLPTHSALVQTSVLPITETGR
jgi:hypothetical protein